MMLTSLKLLNLHFQENSFLIRVQSGEYVPTAESQDEKHNEMPDLSGMHLIDSSHKQNFEQIIYLDFDGENGVTYNGPVTIKEIRVPAFKAPDDLSGLEQIIKVGVIESL